MRVISWNINRRNLRSAWERVTPLNPEIVFLQEAMLGTQVDWLNCLLDYKFVSVERRMSRGGKKDTSKASVLSLIKAPWQFSETSSEAKFESLLPSAVSNNAVTIQTCNVWQLKSTMPFEEEPLLNSNGSRVERWLENAFASKLPENLMIMGDFNAGLSFSDASAVKRSKALFDRLDSLGLKSAYHHLTNEKIGDESTFTFRHTQGSQHFIDYCFLTKNLLNSLSRVSVDLSPIHEKISDHAMLIVDFDLS